MPRFLQRVLQIRPAHVPRRSKSENQACQQRNSERETENGRIHADLVHARHVCRYKAAQRMESSFSRAEACASNRFATLTQAIRRTKATAPRRTRSAGRTLPTIWSFSGTTNIPQPPLAG